MMPYAVRNWKSTFLCLMWGTWILPVADISRSIYVGATDGFGLKGEQFYSVSARPDVLA
jgi:hypothetical protein